MTGRDPGGRLHGARIGLLEARYGDDLVRLVQSHGGIPIWAPAVREAKVECGPQVSAFLDRLRTGGCGIVVFQTGAGARLLFEEADRLGRAEELVAALRGATLVVRGPKPAAVLVQQGLRASVRAPEPYTTAELVRAMEALELAGRCVGLVHYGERNQALLDALRVRGARLEELQLYEWMMPEELEPLQALVREIAAGRLDAVAFTTQVQARHLFRVAEEMGLAPALVRALNSTTVVASIGPTCTAALRSLGVTRWVEPERAKMRPMVAALARYLERHPRRGSLPVG